MAIAIGRRRFIGALGGATAVWPLAARAQQIAGRTARIGILQPSLDDPVVGRGFPAFLDELKKSGFNEGQNLTIETVRIDQDAQRLFAQTADLVRSDVELVVAIGSEDALQAALGASTTIPIVIWANNYDPIAGGYVKNLARPGGNVTGIVSLQTELAAKRVELLTQALPGKTRLAILWDVSQRSSPFEDAEHQAKSLGLTVQSLVLENPPYDFDAAFRSLAVGSPQMLLVLSGPNFTLSRAHIAGLAIQQRLPTMFIFKLYAEAGGLISYGVDPLAIYRQLGFYAGKILDGAKPADLPIEQPVKFELVINRKTAKAIGVELSTAISRAPTRRSNKPFTVRRMTAAK